MNLKDIAQLVTDKISSRQVTLQDYVTTASCCDRTYITLSPTLNCAILIFIQTRICHRTGRSNRTSGQGNVSCPAPCDIPQAITLPIQFHALAPLAVYLLLGDLPRTADRIHQSKVFLILYYGHGLKFPEWCIFTIWHACVPNLF